MFISLTFVDTGHNQFYDSTINASQIRSFKARTYFHAELQTRPDGTQITWIDPERSPSIVTAKPEQIAAALSAVDLRDASA